jgi:hypothetical protein
MTDGTGAGGGEGGGEGGGAGGGAAGSEMGAPPAWMAQSGIPADLMSDANLVRTPDVPTLARRFVESQTKIGDLGRQMEGKLAIPAVDAGPEAWAPVFDKLGRPKDATAYELPTPDGKDTAMTTAFRPIAHQLGLLPGQAKGVAEFYNAQVTAAMDSHLQKGNDEIAALKAEMGARYEPAKEAAKRVYEKLGLPPEFADELDTKVGSGALLKGFMQLARQTGELALVDGDDPGQFGGVADKNAEATLDAKMADKGWREKYLAGDTATVGEYNRLLKQAQNHAQKA